MSARKSQPPRRTLVRVFESDPDLLRRVQPDLANRMRRHVMAEVIEVPVGLWRPPPEVDYRTLLGLLVLDGLLMCSVLVGGRRGVELHGEGDLIRPWNADTVASVPFELGWTALTPTWLAVLDREFEMLVARCPGVMAEMVDRLARRDSLAVARALAQVPLLESRLLIFMWQLADRWGRVEPEGVVIDLELNQSMLGDLIGARRQSVSRTVGALTRRGVLAKSGDKWILIGSPPNLAGLASRRPMAPAEPAQGGSA